MPLERVDSTIRNRVPTATNGRNPVVPCGHLSGQECRETSSPSGANRLGSGWAPRRNANRNLRPLMCFRRRPSGGKRAHPQERCGRPTRAIQGGAEVATEVRALTLSVFFTLQRGSPCAVRSVSGCNVMPINFSSSQCASEILTKTGGEHLPGFCQRRKSLIFRLRYDSCSMFAHVPPAPSTPHRVPDRPGLACRPPWSRCVRRDRAGGAREIHANSHWAGPSTQAALPTACFVVCPTPARWCFRGWGA